MRHKNQKPPIYIGGSEKLRAMDRPRYMNVPFPAPCHVAVAGVGKQSVWGFRIIACISIITLALFRESVNTQKWRLRSQLQFSLAMPPGKDERRSQMECHYSAGLRLLAVRAAYHVFTTLFLSKHQKL